MHIYFTINRGPLYSGRKQGQLRAKQEFVPGHVDGSLTVIHIHVEPGVYISSAYFSGLLDIWLWNAIVVYCNDPRVMDECDRFITNYNRIFKVDLPYCFRKPADTPGVCVAPLPTDSRLAVKDLEWW